MIPGKTFSQLYAEKLDRYRSTPAPMNAALRRSSMRRRTKDGRGIILGPERIGQLKNILEGKTDPHGIKPQQISATTAWMLVDTIEELYRRLAKGRV